MSFLSAQETTCKCCIGLSCRSVVFVTECSDSEMFDWICMSFLSAHETTCGFVSSPRFVTFSFCYRMFRFEQFCLDLHVVSKCRRNDVRMRRVPSSCYVLFRYGIYRCWNFRLDLHVVSKYSSNEMRICFVPLFHYALFSLRNVPILKFPIGSTCRF